MDKAELDTTLARCYYPFGAPNLERLPVGLGPLTPQVSVKGIVAVAKALGQPVRYEDEDGYEHAIVAGALHPTKGWPAWIVYRCKEYPGYVDVEFRLQASLEGQLAIDWPLQSYNPYFGCHVGYLAWHGDQVVAVYREKHRTYACSLGQDQAPRVITIADGWRVAGDLLVYFAEQGGVVERLALPDLHLLEALPDEEARTQGLLPPSSQEMWEATRKAWMKLSSALRQREEEDG